jgi:Fe-Mn family superoxide dismutase
MATSEAIGRKHTLAVHGVYALKPLPFDPKSLRGLSERLIVSHWENNYGGALKALNAINQRLDDMFLDESVQPFVYGDLKRDQLLRKGSVVLHELYFGNLGGDGSAKGEIRQLIEQDFGSYANWLTEFKKTAHSLSGGSGWVILAFDFHTGKLVNYWGQDHMHSVPLSVPLLVMDMYEHSYHIDFGAAAAKYVEAVLDNINWEEVERRYQRVKHSHL